MNNVFITGKNGLLSKYLTFLDPTITGTTRSELDLLDSSSIYRFIDSRRPELVVHAAAYTNVSKAEVDKELCWRTNVTGTEELVNVCAGYNIPLIFISTDYVFLGNEGNYKEDSIPGPPINFYALSKLAAESAVNACADNMIIRTSFRPEFWPYLIAFSDSYTSQDYVDVIAPKILLAIRNFWEIPNRILHISSERKSHYELAIRRNADVIPGKRSSLIPMDSSLNNDLWNSIEKDLH